MAMEITQKITSCLWFDDKAEEAAKFYTSIFKNSKIGKITRYDEEASQASGRPLGSTWLGSMRQTRRSVFCAFSRSRATARPW